jgi:hypothetical protein
LTVLETNDETVAVADRDRTQCPVGDHVMQFIAPVIEYRDAIVLSSFN